MGPDTTKCPSPSEQEKQSDGDAAGWRLAADRIPDNNAEDLGRELARPGGRQPGEPRPRRYIRINHDSAYKGAFKPR